MPFSIPFRRCLTVSLNSISLKSDWLNPDCLQIIYSENIGFSSWFVNRTFNKVCKHLWTIHSTIQICGNYLKLNVVFAAQHFYLMTNRYIITIKEQEFLCEKGWLNSQWYPHAGTNRNNQLYEEENSWFTKK